MMQFYVYVDKEEELLPEEQRMVYMVPMENIDDYATKQFDPRRHEFSGVIIEADDQYAAKAAYDEPAGEHAASIEWVEEPKVTANIRAGRISKKKIEEISKQIVAMRLYQLTQHVEKALQPFAKLIASQTKATPEEAFILLKKEFADLLLNEDSDLDPN